METIKGLLAFIFVLVILPLTGMELIARMLVTPAVTPAEVLAKTLSSPVSKKSLEELEYEFGSFWEREVGVVLECHSENCSYPQGDDVVLLTVLTERGEEKWQINHGNFQQIHKVEKGYKLIACFCSQQECLTKTPTMTILFNQSESDGHKVLRIYHYSK